MGQAVTFHKPSNTPSITQTNGDGVACDTGYNTKAFIAGGTLLVGDAVYITTTADIVNKSTTDANYLTFVGIVVGGPQLSTSGEIAMGSSMLGSTAALVNEIVIVALETSIVNGIAAAAITAGLRVCIDATTAGRVRVVPASSTKTTFATAIEPQTTAGQPVKLYLHYNQQTVVA